jgi:hypothetical protein
MFDNLGFVWNQCLSHCIDKIVALPGIGIDVFLGEGVHLSGHIVIS